MMLRRDAPCLVPSSLSPWRVRRQHDVLAAVAEHGAQYGLGAAHVGIDVGGIEQRDAEVDRPVNHLARAFEVSALAEIVAAEADGGNTQARAAGGPIAWDGPVKGKRETGSHCGARAKSPQGGAAMGVRLLAGCSAKRCGPGQTRRLTGTAGARDL